VLPVLVLLLAVPSVMLAAGGQPGGEYAIPKQVPYQDPPPSVLWGPFAVPELRGLQWGLYGLSYHGLTDKLCAVYFWQDSVRRYRSVDSTNPANPDTILAFRTPGPVRDSFQDLYYCRYDNSIWVHSSKNRSVFKIDAMTGQIRRQFPTPATRYPTGIAFDERAKKLYLIDRMGEGGYPCSLYVADTLGNVEARRPLLLGSSYAGARCLDMDYTSSNPNWPSLLLIYNYFQSTGTLDSTVLFELDKTTNAVLHRSRLPDLAGYVNNARGVAWDPRNGDYWISIMQNPDNNIYKLDGWYTPYSVDVGVMALTVPRTTAESGAQVIPQAIVRNYGSSTQTFPVRMKLGASYNEVRNKTLAAGREDTVNFPTWYARGRGYVPVTVITELSGDMFTRNDTVNESLLVVRRDAACTQIVYPSGIVDSGQSIAPQAKVYNFGDEPATFTARFRIGSVYSDTVRIPALAPNEERTVSFPSWIVSGRGTLALVCTTMLANDMYPNNDFQTGSVYARVLDAAVSAIIAPIDTVDSGAVATPSVRVSNLGTDAAGFRVRLVIGTRYADEESTYVLPGANQVVSFAQWTATERGRLTVSCSTRLNGDAHNENDRLTGWVFVRVRDIGPTVIVAPTGTVDSGASVYPQAKVKNFGNVTVDFSAGFTIQGGYTNSQNVTALVPDEERVVTFAPWLASPRGVLATRCTTILAGDRVAGNNTVTGSATVSVTDVSAEAILAPSGTIDSGAVVTPRAKVKNYGSAAIFFPVWFEIQHSDCLVLVAERQNRSSSRVQELSLDQLYQDSIWVTVAAGDSTTASFDNWTANAVGTLNLVAFTALAGDLNRANDTARGTVTVRQPVHDVGAVRIVAPVGRIDSGASVIPKALVSNFGSFPETFTVRFQIGSNPYEEVVMTSLPPGVQDTARFAAWIASPLGTFLVRCSTRLASDVNPANDRALDSVTVIPFSSVSEPAAVSLRPNEFSLAGVPNPFAGLTAIRYALPSDGPVRLRIYNPAGRLVRSLLCGQELAGEHEVVWNGRDGHDRECISGLYFCRVEIGNTQLTRMLMKLR
jgi:hypothetical protein